MTERKNAKLQEGIVTAKGGLNVRNKPSMSAKVLRVLSQGDEVKCHGIALGSERSWWKIHGTKNEYVVADFLAVKEGADE